METEIKTESYYKELVNFSLLAGVIMMGSRAETSRVEDMVARILKTSGLPVTEAFVLPTGITVTLSDDKDMTICVNKRTFSGDVNISKIYKVNQVSRDFCSGIISLDDAYKKLKEIDEEKSFPVWVKLIGTSLASGGFSIFFGGSILDGIAALLIGLLLGVCLIYFKKLLQKDFLTIALCSFILAFFGVLFPFLAIKINISISPQYIIAGCLMPLVPGVAITNAVRDVLSGDYLSACSRTVEAAMVAVAIAIGVSGGLFVSNTIGISNEELGFVLDMTRGDVLVDVISFDRLGILVLDGLVEGEGLGALAKFLADDAGLLEVGGGEGVVGLCSCFLEALESLCIFLQTHICVTFAGEGTGGEDGVLAAIFLQIGNGAFEVAQLEFALAGIQVDCRTGLGAVFFDHLLETELVAVALEGNLPLLGTERCLCREELGLGLSLAGLHIELVESEVAKYDHCEDCHADPDRLAVLLEEFFHCGDALANLCLLLDLLRANFFFCHNMCVFLFFCQNQACKITQNLSNGKQKLPLFINKRV